MKKILILSFIVIFGCSTKKINTQQSENIKLEFIEMHEIDQIAANYKPNGKFENYPKENWSKFKDSVFTKHKNRIEELYNKHGYLGIKEIGKEGAFNFWLFVQHSDKYPEFQKRILKQMKKEVKKGNANANDYAYLVDRVKVNNGEKQMFGTQVDYRVNGQAKPKNGLIDSINIEKIRTEYKLSKLTEYLNQMTEINFEMNREVLEKNGILKPVLYE
jgi:hypothetical protein